MLHAALLLALAAEPTTATILVRRTAVPQVEAERLMDKLTRRLAVPGLLEYAESQKRLGAVALKDGTTCGGKSDCHVELARQLRVEWLVLVSVSQIAQDQSLALELFQVSTQAVVENESVLLPKRGEVPGEVLEGFSARVTKRLEPVVVKPPVDAPVVVSVVPEPKPVAPVLVAEVPVARSHAAGLVVGGLGVAALGVGVGLLINGLAMRAPLSSGMVGADGRVRSEVPGSQAQAINDASSVQFAIAGAAGAVGLALGGTAIAIW